MTRDMRPGQGNRTSWIPDAGRIGFLYNSLGYSMRLSAQTVVRSHCCDSLLLASAARVARLNATEVNRWADGFQRSSSFGRPFNAIIERSPYGARPYGLTLWEANKSR